MNTSTATRLDTRLELKTLHGDMTTMTNIQGLTRAERDAAICAYYEEGHKVAQCASRFQLGRMRVIQILQKAGVWRPYVKSDRTQFLGVSVTQEGKAALAREADRQGTSMSAVASDLIEDLRAKETT